MKQKEKDRLSKKESSHRKAMLVFNLDLVMGKMRESGVVDPIGVIMDVVGTYGRKTMVAWNQGQGMTLEEANRKVDEMIAYYEGQGEYPTITAVWDWPTAESLMPLTSPTSAEALKKLKHLIEPGQAVVIAVGRHGNSYSIVNLTEGR